MGAEAPMSKVTITSNPLCGDFMQTASGGDPSAGARRRLPFHAGRLVRHIPCE